MLLSWEVGQRIRTEVLGLKRAEYGERVVRSVAEGLTADYGWGYSEKNLRHMIRFAERFPNREIVSALTGYPGMIWVRKLFPSQEVRPTNKH